MQRAAIAVAVFAILGASASTAHAVDYYVRATGSDSNMGTMDSDAGAWRTVGRCATRLVAGDVCHVAAGSYPENITTLAHGGTSDADRVVYRATGTATIRSFTIDQSYVTFDGFEVTGCSSGACAGNVEVLADFASVINNDIHDNPNTSSGSEIRIGRMGSVTGVLLRGNHVHSAINRGDDYVLLEMSCISCLIDDNELGPGTDVDDIRPWGHDNVVSNNYFHDSTLSSGSAAHMDIVQTFADGCPTCMSYNFTFKQNLVRNGEQLFNLSNDSAPGMHDFTFVNNVYIHMALQGNVGIPNTHILNNTFIDVDPANGFTFNMAYGGGFDDTGAVIKNNIIIQTWGDAPYGQGSRVSGDYNLIAQRTGSTYAPISGWSEAHGLNGMNPEFVSYSGDDAASTNDFHLRASSAAIDTGTDLSPLGVTTDHDGTARPQGAGYDIGAYEHCTGTACMAAMVDAGGGAMVDAGGGAMVDAGGGAMVDAGGGAMVDAGGGAMVDAGGGAMVDAGGGALVDAGGGALVDAGGGALVDAGRSAGVDAGPRPTDPDACTGSTCGGPGSTASGGCGCHIAQPERTSWRWLGLVLAVMLHRTRRRAAHARRVAPKRSWISSWSRTQGEPSIAHERASRAR